MAAAVPQSGPPSSTPKLLLKPQTRQDFEAAKAKRTKQKNPTIQMDPDPKLVRHQFRCKREQDWPDGCTYIAPTQPYPQVSAADYGYGIFSEFDGETYRYELRYTGPDGTIDSYSFTLSPATCGPQGYSYFLGIGQSGCTWGGISIIWLYPNPKGRLTAKVLAAGVTVFYQLLDAMPLTIVKQGGNSQLGLTNTAFRFPLQMAMKDFEGQAPHYPVRSDTSSYGEMKYTITGPARTSGMAVSGNSISGDGSFVANGTFGSKVGVYEVSAIHTDSDPLAEPFVATAVTRADPDDNKDKEEGGGEEECSVADPINIGIGNSFQQEVDYARTGLSLLEFERSYNALGSKSRLMRNYWTTTFDRAVLPPPIAGAPTRVRRPDGRVIPFMLQAGVYQPMRPYFYGTLRANGTGWRYVTEDNITETYDAQGRWTTIADAVGRNLVAAYNSKGNLTKVTANTGESLTFTYNTFNQIGSVNDQTGRVWTYTYNGFANLTQLKDPDGVYHTYHYQAPSSPYLLTGISIGRNATPFPDERYVTWEFDAAGRATSNYFSNGLKRFDIVYNDITGDRMVTDAVGNQSTYKTRTLFGRGFVDGVVGPGFATCGFADSEVERDLNMNVISRTAFARTTQFGSFDAKGQYGLMVEAAGKPAAQQTTYLYDPRFIGKPISISSPSVAAGRTMVTQYAYDAAGNMTQAAVNGFRPDGTAVSRSATFQYTGPYGQLAQVDGPRTDVADITRFEYNATTKRLLRVTDPNGIVLRNNITYTSTGQIAAEDRPNGQRVTYAYYPGTDQLKSITELGTGATRTMTWTYNDRRWVASLTLSDGVNPALISNFDYDAAGDLTRISSPDAGEIRYTLDDAGNRIKDSYKHLAFGSPEARWIQRTFDAYGRVKDLINPTNQSISDFHPEGTLTSSTDGRNNTTSYTYDDFKRITRVLQPGQIATTFGYDNRDQLTRVTDGNQAITDQAYDDLGNRLRLDSPDTGVTTFSHDAAGNVIGATDALGQATTYVYDAGNRLRTVDRIGAAEDETYLYDTCLNGAGRVCSATNGIGDVVSYEYDHLGRIAKQTTNAGVVAYKYDAANNVTEITYPSLRKVRYRRDSAGQVIAVSVVDSGNPYPLATTISRLPFGPATRWTYGNGVVETRQYDLQYRPLAFDSGGRSAVSYGGYDGNSNITGRTVNGEPQAFAYTAQDRLDTAAGGFGSRNYDYDAVGNRSNLLADGQTTGYAYQPQSNRLLSDSNFAYGRDANGNETRRQAADGSGWELTHTASNRLLGVVDLQNPAMLLGGYRYNALGQRTVKSTPYNDTRFVYGLSGELLAETLTGGSVVQEYVYLDGSPIALLGVPATPAQPFSVNQIVDNPTGIGGCRNIRTSLAVSGSYLRCDSTSTNNTVDWPWQAPVSGTYEVQVMWPWDGSMRCFNATQKYCLGGDSSAAPAAGAWATLGYIHFAAGSRGLWVNTYDRYLGGGTYRAEMDAARFVLQYSDVSVRDYKYVHSDALGTPLRVTDEAGGVVWQASYDPFGTASVDDDPDGDGLRQTLNLRFPGQYYDAETGLHYNYFRDYDPRLGRYLQSDPIGLAGGVNSFAYVGGNPVSYVDPLGLEGVGPWNSPGLLSQWGSQHGQYGSQAYQTSRQWRTWGHQTFPGETNSAVRHCVVSCILGSRLGTGIARSAGVVNEAQGLVLDIRNLRSRLNGDSPEACQKEDLANNERGFGAANNILGGLTDSQLSQSCTQQCM